MQVTAAAGAGGTHTELSDASFSPLYPLSIRQQRDLARLSSLLLHCPGAQQTAGSAMLAWARHPARRVLGEKSRKQASPCFYPRRVGVTCPPPPVMKIEFAETAEQMAENEMRQQSEKTDLGMVGAFALVGAAGWNHSPVDSNA